MYTLYYLPGACSLATHVALIEVSAAFETISIAVPDGQPRTPEFLKINPRGSAPVLVKDGHILRESAAILTTLLDDHQSPLLPASGPERATTLEWLAFANATLHPAYGRCFFQQRHLGANAASNPLYSPSIAAIQKLWDEVEERLNVSTHLAGEACSIADILVTVIANWTPRMQQPIILGPKTKAMFTRVVARPSFQQAMASEGVTYKVAA
jgi:glutathione S-transferase